MWFTRFPQFWRCDGPSDPLRASCPVAGGHGHARQRDTPSVALAVAGHVVLPLNRFIQIANISQGLCKAAALSMADSNHPRDDVLKAQAGEPGHEAQDFIVVRSHLGPVRAQDVAVPYKVIAEG